MKYIYFLIPVLLIVGCSDDISLHTEEVDSEFKFQLSQNDYITISGDNLDFQAAQSIAESVENSLKQEVELLPSKGATQKAPEEVAFTEFPWWDGSYYWENHHDLDITHQTFIIGFINPGIGDLTIFYYREIKKGSPVIPFFKWQWGNDAMPLLIDGKEKEYIMTCVSAKLIGPIPFLKTLEVKAAEKRTFSKYKPCIVNDPAEDPIFNIYVIID